MATFAYGRVSTKEQSTENQRLEIQQAGYRVDYWFADEGVSGKVMAQQRPQFARLLTQIRDSETLVVSKLDRLGRDAHDVGGTIKLMASRGIKVIVLQVGTLDLTSPAGKMMLTMLAAVAELERDLLVERTQAGLARARQQGKVLGRPATTTAEQRADILTRHKAGASISELVRAPHRRHALNALGEKDLGPCWTLLWLRFIDHSSVLLRNTTSQKWRKEAAD